MGRRAGGTRDYRIAAFALRPLRGGDGEKHGDFLAGAVLGGGAGAAGAFSVAGPFLDGVEPQAGITEGFDVGLKGAVKSPGVLAIFFPGVGDDGGFAGEEIAIDAAKLHGCFFIPLPARFLWAAEAGVHHDQDEAAGRGKDAGNSSKDGREGIDVLDGQDAGGGGIMGLRQGGEIEGIGETVVDLCGAALAGDVDEGAGGIDAGHGGAEGVEMAAEDALSAGDVDDSLARARGQKAGDAGKDNVLMKIGAGFADELVIPPGDGGPICFCGAGGHRHGVAQGRGKCKGNGLRRRLQNDSAPRAAGRPG